MAYWTHTKDPIGCFVEKDVGNHFEYSHNDDPFSWCEDFPHKIWVGGVVNDQGYRYGLVKKTVAYILTNDEDGNDVKVDDMVNSKSEFSKINHSFVGIATDVDHWVIE